MSVYVSGSETATSLPEVDHDVMFAPLTEPDVRIPRSAGEITTGWLNTVLAAHLREYRVLGSQAKPFSEPGQTADVVEITLIYDSAKCDLPTRMIAKLAASDPTTREMCRLFRHYENETGFYRTFDAGGLPIARCFHTGFDPESYDAVILLEHLAPSICPSYSITLDQVRLAITEVAKLHARWWNDHFVKRQPCLIQLDDRVHWSNVAQGAVAAIDRIEKLVGDNCSASVEVMRVYANRLENISSYMRQRPFTLMHSDFHPKQMFFPNGAGKGKFAVIDFQFSVAGPGAFDVSRLLNLGLDTNVRRSHERGILDGYCEELRRLGVKDYDHTELLIDLKFGAFFSQLINFIALDQTDHALIEQECAEHEVDWREVWLMRGEAMIRDLDVIRLLRSV